MQQPTSQAPRDKHRPAEAGFTLLEMVCVMAILAILVSIAIPGLPHATSKPRLESYAVATAALLKADRNAALRRQHQVATVIDAPMRLVRSGATGRVIQVSDDVTFDAILAARCGGSLAGSEIAFFPNGMSCGGVITLARLGASYEVRVNWLTGGVEVVALHRA